MHYSLVCGGAEQCHEWQFGAVSGVYFSACDQKKLPRHPTPHSYARPHRTALHNIN